MINPSVISVTKCVKHAKTSQITAPVAMKIAIHLKIINVLILVLLTPMLQKIESASLVIPIAFLVVQAL